MAGVLTALTETADEPLDLSEDELRDVLLDELGDDFILLQNDCWASLERLSDERVFTHRLTQTEIDHDSVAITPDLELLGLFESPVRHLELTDGSRLLLRFPRVDTDAEESGPPAGAIDPEGSVLFPPGTLTGLAARIGDVLCVRLTDEGIELGLTGAEDLTPHPDALRQRLTELAAVDQPVDAGDVLMNVLADVDAAFREPHPPLDALLIDLRIARDRSWLARDGFDFTSHWRDTRARALVDRYELTRDEALSLVTLIAVHRRLVERAGAPDVWADQDAELDAALAILKDPHLANAFYLEVLTEIPDGASELILLTEHAEDRGGRSVRPALRWLRAKAYQWLGQISESETHLLAAERLDPSWPLDPARSGPLRQRSRRCRTRTGPAPPRRPVRRGSGLVELLTAIRPTPGPTVGRNEPCWCGSGRKFKQCHLHQPARPVARRAGRPGSTRRPAASCPTDRGCRPWRLWPPSAPRTPRTTSNSRTGFAIHSSATPCCSKAGRSPSSSSSAAICSLLTSDCWPNNGCSSSDPCSRSPTSSRGEGLTARDLRTGDVHQVRDTDREPPGESRPVDLCPDRPGQGDRADLRRPRAGCRCMTVKR